VTLDILCPRTPAHFPSPLCIVHCASSALGCKDSASGAAGMQNFFFTTEVKLQFTYNGTEVFTFSGDDDVWVIPPRAEAHDYAKTQNPRLAARTNRIRSRACDSACACMCAHLRMRVRACVCARAHTHDVCVRACVCERARMFVKAIR
jgi:hypothetical protein